MLPRIIYEALPYLYLSIGFSSGLIFRSSIIFIAASLLITTGILILYMRFNYRHRLQQELPHEDGLGRSRSSYISRQLHDRRQSPVTEFPLIDHYGYLVANDRRRGERRALFT